MPRIIRASEIGSYLYCHKSWKYQRQEKKSENQVEMQTGTELHHAHGRTVIATGFTRGLSILFLVLAALAFVQYLVSITN